jgi:hypothetical protein
MVRAKKILSGKVLADPRSSQARRTISFLEEDTRLEQLCDLEAMAQIAEWHKEFHPDRVVAYAMADLKIEANTTVAEGAAFHSDHKWYKLKFKCEIEANRQTVRAFEFSVGNSIPRKAWERYGLPDEEWQNQH